MNVIIAFFLVMAALFAALIKLRISPAVALFSCAVLMAFLCGFSVSETLSCLTDGFGAVMRSIGLQIVFGGIFGMMLGDSGAMEELAKAVLRKIGRKHDLLALNLASWLIFVPVFFDPAYITLSPLAESLQRFTGKRPGAYVTALFMGILTSHCLIPPAAGPLAVAGQVGADLGWFILYGLVVSLPASLLCGWCYAEGLNRRKAARVQATLRGGEDVLRRDPEKPPVRLTVCLILLPVVLLLAGCVSGALLPASHPVTVLLSFIGNSNIALLLAMLAAAFALRKHLIPKSADTVWKYIDRAPAALGGFLVVVGCGSSFGSVLQHSGLGDTLIALLSGVQFPIILLAFLLTTVIRAAVGSGTVAMMTSAAIVGPAAVTMGESPVVVGLAVCAGALTLTLPSDAAFWLPEKYNRLAVGETLKAITWPSLAAGAVSLPVVLALHFAAGLLPGLH